MSKIINSIKLSEKEDAVICYEKTLGKIELYSTKEIKFSKLEIIKSP